jgi:hypothetical protein
MEPDHRCRLAATRNDERLARSHLFEAPPELDLRGTVIAVAELSTFGPR